MYSLSKTANINEEISKIYKEITGSGPKKLKTFIVEDMIIVRFDWYNEHIIKKINECKGDNSSVVGVIEDLFEIARPQFIKAVENCFNLKVTKMYFDAKNIEQGKEKVVIFLMEEKIDIN